MTVACTHCNTPIPESSVDRARDIATCPSCARVIDLLAEAPPATEPAAAGPRLRDPVPLPPNMEIRAESAAPNVITITRRWLRGKHYVLLLVVLAMSGGAAFAWLKHGFSVLLSLGTVFVMSWAYNLLTMFVNRTVIRAGDGSVDVRHGPLPSIFSSRNRSVPASNLKQLYAARKGALFAVEAQLTDGQAVGLVWPFTSAEQAIFVEQQIERVLGLVDFAVPGELGADYPAAVAGSGAKAASGGAALAVMGPLMVVGGIAFFLSVSSSTLEGSVTAGGALGTWSFTPDDCSSGQRQGFFGVQLSASTDPARRIRVVRDAVRGDAVVVEEPSQRRRTVIDSSQCRRFDVQVGQTNTSINDVWVMEGRAILECDLLSGSVSFSGCH